MKRHPRSWAERWLVLSNLRWLVLTLTTLFGGFLMSTRATATHTAMVAFIYLLCGFVGIFLAFFLAGPLLNERHPAEWIQATIAIAFVAFGSMSLLDVFGPQPLVIMLVSAGVVIVLSSHFLRRHITSKA